MEIVWEDPPEADGPFFTRDVYESTFSTSLQDLFSLLHRHSPVKGSSWTPPAGCSAEDVQEDSSREDCDSADSSLETPESKEDAPEPKSKKAFPEPRVPYPCQSALSKTEQRKYCHFLLSKKKEKVPLSQVTLNRVNHEVMQFMMYLQEVSLKCAEDYNIISPGAVQYTQELFQSRLEHMKTLPEVYQIHELTTLTGGKFNPALTLTFEKLLLHMGNVIMTDLRPVTANTALASDYFTVSSHTPPAKKAKELHASVSEDARAERLCSCYEPDVCLTEDALLELLNNHGPDFRDEWEIPVLVKSSPSKDKGCKKVVFIESPLLKTEVTFRERSHIYHEESLKMSVKKTGNINISQVLTELPISARNASGRTLTTSTTALHDDSMEFEVDLSDLETFGDITPSNVKKTESDRDSAAVKRKKTVSQTNECSKNESVASLDDDVDSMNSESLKNSDHLPSTVDSDDDKLIIADASPKVTEKQGETPSPELCSQPKARGAKQRRKSPASADQLGEILQMQTAMFTSKTADRASKGSKNSPSSRPEPPQPQQTSLVKACVSSYLERNPNQEEETGDVVQNVAAPESAGCKKRLTLDLQELTEDERDYEGPEEGNVLYKLFSLDELLLMVRTSIDFTHTRKLENENKCVPVKVFPKLEYQLTYGVECLSNSEACQLWTETLLHSSTDLFIAHIDAFTSKVALVRQLQDDWIYNVHTVFKPAKSLNILHHILQKLTGLDEGRYLLRHKVGEPFVNILKAAPGNGRQGVHNLQQIHSDVPPPPSSAVPPWIPLDPTVVLPVHRQHGRVPCTFPPKDYTPPQQWRTLQSKQNKGGQPGKKKPKRKPKKKNQPRK